MQVRVFTGKETLSGHRKPPCPGSVHLWHLSWTRSDVAQCDVALLSADERARCRRFYFADDAHGFSLARSWLRRVLGAYCACEPQELTFGYGQWGKPVLPDCPVSFNLSHCKGSVKSHAVVAIAHAHENVGVDIETLRNIADAETLLPVFSPAERMNLRKFQAAERKQEILRLWTGKESVVKTLGQGLSRPLDSFHVQTTPMRLLSMDGQRIPPGMWAMETPDLGPEPCCALALLRKVPRTPADRFWNVFDPDRAVHFPERL